MTSNQRRPGFRLPWAAEASPEADAEADAEAADTPPAAAAPSRVAAEPKAVMQDGDDEPPAQAEVASGRPDPVDSAGNGPQEPVEPAPAPAAGSKPPSSEPSTGFMRDLVTAMRRVADETRQSGISTLRTRVEEQVRSLEADAERRREELKSGAEVDVVAVGNWADTEMQRIKQEAEQRVAARRARLDQQLAAEATRAEAEATSLRERIAEYERELDAYHAQLSDIADPAAFVAAAKRMPAPPRLDGGADAAPPKADSERPSPGASPSSAPIHPDEEEVLASRLAELDAALEHSSDGADPDSVATASPGAASSAEPTSTEILVKGLGSFGAITGFRQALAGVDGVEGVSLSLGPTGEFVFRAIHPTGFDVSAAIARLEGDAAKIETNADGALWVTLDRAR